MIGPSPMCMECARFRKEDKVNFSCDAYPDGIPEQIVMSEWDHRKSAVGDRGLQFVPIDPENIGRSGNPLLLGGDPR